MFEQTRKPLGSAWSPASLGILTMAIGAVDLLRELVSDRPADWLRLVLSVGLLTIGVAMLLHARLVKRLTRAEGPWVDEARRRLARNDRGGAVTAVCDATGVSRADAISIIDSWGP